MSEHLLQNPSNPGYRAVVDRTDELERLRVQARKRKSMLVFGREGVGKTHLLHSFVKTQPLALYVSQTHSPRELMLALMEALNRVAKGNLHLPVSPPSLSTSSLKGVIQRTLDLSPFLLVLDHLSGPSRIATGIIKDLNYYGRTPVFFAARTPHMEDIGSLQPMCADRSERVELKNFPSPVAREFAQREAERTGLWASNLEHALHSLVERGDGNPASILQMIKMAHLPKYRMDDQIKTHVLYLDYIMGRR
ncbi:MAG: hypothetical protein ABSA39_20530 [Edaphobacter sp.]